MTRLSRSALLEVPAEIAYQVVADVTRYPEFLPGCEQVEIKKTRKDGLVAKVTVSGKGLTQSFVTTNTHTPNSILMSLKEGPFKSLEGAWYFSPIGDVGCRIEVRLVFEAKGLLARMLSGLAENVANRMVDAFTQRIVDVASGVSDVQSRR